MAEVRVYTTRVCAYCAAAKALLTRKRVPYKEIDVTADADTRAWLVTASGQRTVPQIFIGDRSIGGFTELHDLDQRGELDGLLAG